MQFQLFQIIHSKIQPLQEFFKWAIDGLFFFIFVFPKQLNSFKFYIKITDDRNRTTYLCWRKQLRHNHYPISSGI